MIWLQFWTALSKATGTGIMDVNMGPKAIQLKNFYTMMTFHMPHIRSMEYWDEHWMGVRGPEFKAQLRQSLAMRSWVSHFIFWALAYLFVN